MGSAAPAHEAASASSVATDLEVYHTLDPSRFQIRRLTLYPGEFEDPLRCALDIISMNDSPSYGALSYVWGKDLALSSMKIGMTDMAITKNLDAALRHLRHHSSNRLLWVDAISINQNDFKEKADQVQQMGLIYSKAEKVIVWLGDADQSLAPARDFLNALNDWKETVRSFGADTKQSGSRRSRSNQKDPDFAHVLRSQRRPSSVLQGLMNLLSRPYWERVWIIQEISKATKVEIAFGQFRVQLNPLLLASKNVTDLSERTQTLLKTIVKFRAQEQGYGGLSISTRMPLIEALVSSRYSLASDPRDKIYALLGLTCDGSDLIPMPTYSGSLQRIYYDLTDAIIRSQQPSNVLLFSHWVPLRERFPAEAKWCIDWENLSYHLPPWLTKGSRSPAKTFASKVDFDGSHLVTTGQCVARIVSVQGVGRKPAAVRSPTARDLFGRDKETEDEFEAPKIMERITFDLLNRLAPKFGLTTFPSQTEKIDALARMIRDVDKGESSADYDLSSSSDVLGRLGSLSWQRNPVWEWARQYNYVRASETSDIGVQPKPVPRTMSTASTAVPSRKLTPATVRTKKLPSLTRSPPGSATEQLDTRLGRENSQAPVRAGNLSPLAAPFSPRPQAPPQAAFEFWEYALSTLDTMPEYKLRFAHAVSTNTEEEHLVLVCDGARPGDLVYCIEHANLPVLLREGYGGCDLIGEVCISRKDTGEWSMGDFDNQADMFQVNTPGLTAKIIHIRLEEDSIRRIPSYGSMWEI